MIALFLVLAALGTPGPGVCSAAADVTIDSAKPEKLGTTAGVTTYLIHISVLNRGARAQSPGTRQIVATYHDEDRVARTTVPALAASEAYAFTTKFRRANDAGKGSTTLLFQLGGLNYAPRSAQDCDDRNNSIRVTF